MGSSTFSGNFSHTIDPKGRVTIPASFRDKLGKSFTIGLNQQFNALALYPANVWAEYELRFKNVPAVDEMGMRYVHLLNDNAFTDCELDAQGRVLLPPSLRQLIKLDKNIRFVGAVTILEIWDEALYTQYTSDSLEDKQSVIKHFRATYYQSGSEGSNEG